MLAVVTVPDTGSEQDRVARLQVLLARHGPVPGCATDDDGDLDEGVGVDLHRLVVDPAARPREGALGEEGPAARHRDR